MQGTVRLVNLGDGVAAVETEHGEFTVFGLLDDIEIAVGDIVSGPLESLDQQVFVNETRSVSMNVYVEDCELQRADAELRVG